MHKSKTFLGWNVQTNHLNNINKSIIIMAPHTSNWDFFIGILATKISQLKILFIIKNEWNLPIIGAILKKLGAIFVDRNKSSGLTKSLSKKLCEMHNGHIIFTPEGTRSAVTKWKSGFYTIASELNLPIAIGYIDYKEKNIGIHALLTPTGNKKKDTKILKEFYKTITPKIKTNFEPNWEL